MGKHYLHVITGWDWVSEQIKYRTQNEIAEKATDDLLNAKVIFYTALAEKATRIGSDISSLG